MTSKQKKVTVTKQTDDVVIVPGSPKPKSPKSRDKRQRLTDSDSQSDLFSRPSSACSTASAAMVEGNTELLKEIQEHNRATRSIIDTMQSTVKYLRTVVEDIQLTCKLLTSRVEKIETQDLKFINDYVVDVKVTTKSIRDRLDGIEKDTHKTTKGLESLAEQLDKDKQKTDEETDETINKISKSLVSIYNHVKDIKVQNETLPQKVIKEVNNILTVPMETANNPVDTVKDTEDHDKELSIAIQTTIDKSYIKYSEVKSTLFKNGKKFPKEQVKAKITDTEQFEKFKGYRDTISTWYISGQHFSKKWRTESHKPTLVNIHTTWNTNVTNTERDQVAKEIEKTWTTENRKLQENVAKRLMEKTQEIAELLTKELQTNEILFAKAFRSVIFKNWYLRDKKPDTQQQQEEET